MIDMTVDYVKDRHQFGVPVGSYQAVKHHFANALLKVEYARPVVYRAAYTLTHDEPTIARCVLRQGLRQRGRGVRRARRPAVPRRHRLLVRVRPAPLDEAGVGAATAWGDTAFHRRRVADAILKKSPEIQAK